MVLLGKEKASFLEPLTVESVGVFEYLADTFHRYLLCQDLLTSFLEGRHIEAISQREEFIDTFGIYLDSV